VQGHQIDFEKTLSFMLKLQSLAGGQQMGLPFINGGRASYLIFFSFLGGGQ